MTESLENLIAALRQELQDYGHLLELLDHQQGSILNRASDDVLQSALLIQAHAATLQASRSCREERQARVAVEFNAADKQLTTLIGVLPPDYRPLVQALVQENNQLLVRVRQRAQQNHLLLARSLETMHRFMQLLFPGLEPSVYNQQGVLPVNAPGHSLYEAVG